MLTGGQCQIYTVAAGDALVHIAKQYDTTVEHIMQQNLGVPNANAIHEGQALLICPGTPNQSEFMLLSKISGCLPRLL
jgi:LysM repeat protein